MEVPQIILPRPTPDRDSRYMGLAWMYAGFSKDPSAQVGAQIVAVNNYPLGAGYNGPPRTMKDDAFSWCRPDPDHPERLSKYDVVIHAEINAIDHSDKNKLPGSTLYVTGCPCKACMKDIAKAEIARVVWLDLPTPKGSMLSNPVYMGTTEEIARLNGVQLEKFQGDLSWLIQRAGQLKELGLCP